MDVVDWLRDLGLEQYVAAFRGNAVTADLLPDLTQQDLKEIGVTAVGHRLFRSGGRDPGPRTGRRNGYSRRG